MKKQYEKSPVLFSFIMIFLYLFAEALITHIGVYVGAEIFVETCVLMVMSAILLVWVLESNLRLGLCRPKKPAGYFLYYIPLILLTGQNLWAGFAVPDSVGIILIHVVKMFGAAMIEELLFRGFLLHALFPYGKKHAILLSSLIFGLVHLMNLTGGMQWEFVLLQVVCAGFIGALYGVLTCKSGSILPAMLAHWMNNCLSIIGKRPEEPLLYGGILILGTVLYIRFLIKNDRSHMHRRAITGRK